MYKQVIVVRSDLKLSKGKLAVQVAHASVDALDNCGPEAKDEWSRGGAKKVVLKVPGLKELLELKKKAGAAKLPVALVRDAGKTELPPGTVTALGIGPGEEGKIDRITGGLKMV